MDGKIEGLGLVGGDIGHLVVLKRGVVKYGCLVVKYHTIGAVCELIAETVLLGVVGPVLDLGYLLV